MSLNKFTSSDPQKAWMKIGCDELKCGDIVANSIIGNGINLAPTNGAGTTGYILQTDGVGSCEWVPENGGLAGVNWVGTQPTQADEIAVFAGITGTTLKQSGVLLSDIEDDINDLNNEVAGKVNKTGDTMTGNLTMLNARVLSDNGTTGAPAYSFSNATGTGLYLAGAGFPVVMGLSALGTTALYIASNGLSSPVPFSTDTITEYNPASGTNINSVLIKTNSIDCKNPATLTIGGTTASQINLGSVVSPVQVQGTLKTDIIDEKTLANGVVVDGVLLKDSSIDRSTAGTLAIGGTTQTALNLGKASTLTTNLGIFANTIGTASDPSYTFTGDNNTGIYSQGAGTISFTSAGVRKMAIGGLTTFYNPIQLQPSNAGSNPITLQANSNDVIAFGTTTNYLITITNSTNSVAFNGVVNFNTAINVNSSFNVNNSPADLKHSGTIWKSYYASGAKILGEAYTQLSTQTIANTVAETSLFNDISAFGTRTIPANFLQVGSIIEIKGCGTLDTKANQTGTVNFKIGGATIATATGNLNGDPQDMFNVCIRLTVRSIGAVGSLVACGYLYHKSGQLNLISTGSPIDTLNANAIDITFLWAVADPLNAISQYQGTIHII